MFDTLKKMVRSKPISMVSGNSLEGRFLRTGLEEICQALPNLNIEIVTGLSPNLSNQLVDKYHDYLGTENRMVIIEASDDFEMPKELARLLPVYKHPYPSTAQIIALYLENNLDISDQKIGLGRGMTYAELTMVLKEAKYAEDFWGHVEECRKEKLALVGMEIEPPPLVRTVGGLDGLMAELPLIRAGFSDQAIQAGLRFPKGILIFGVPGTGKSLVASVIAAELAMPMLSLGIDLVCDYGVGPLKKMLAMAEQCSPCILLIDEIDKFFAVGSKKEPFGYLLKWLNDRRTPVFVIGTGNNMLGVPPELLRAGRWNEIYSVTMPDANGLVAQFKLHLGGKDKRYLDPDFISPGEWRLLTDAAINFVGAEVAEVVHRVSLQMVAEGASLPLKISFDRVLSEAGKFKRQFNRSAKAILDMSQQVENVCTPAGGSTQVLEAIEIDIY
jgi:ATPase family associated with various cellular activities (AAA)